MPPPESRFRIAKTGGAMVAGMYFGYVHKAGNALDGTAPDQEPKFPMREAYEIAQTKVKNVVIPPGGPTDGPAGQGTRLGPQATQSFGDRDPGEPSPPPPARGEAAPPPKDDDDSDGDGPGGVIVHDVPVVPDGRGPQ
eukprot:5189995-Pyramimonas_sp.AAC.1